MVETRLHTVCLAAICFGACASGDPFALVDEVEPNNVVSQAVVTGLVDRGTVIVDSGEIGDGSLGDADRDFFSFQVTPQARLPLLLTLAVSAEEPGYDGYLRLFGYFFDKYEELLNHDDIDETHRDPLLQTYIVEPGTYYVGVSHALNPAYSPTDETSGRPSAVGGYALAIILAEVLIPDSPFESGEAGPISAADTPMVIRDQFIGDGGEPLKLFDRDSYCVEVDAPAILRARVTSTHLGLLDPNLAVDGIEAYERLRRDLKGAQLEVAILQPGCACVTVDGGQDFPTTLGFYDLFIDVQPVSIGGGPLEPNDSILEPTLTGLSGPGSATFSAFIGDGVFGQLRGDVDFFALPPVLDEQLDIEVSPLGDPAGLVPVVHLYDHLGVRLATFTADESDAVHGSFLRRCGDRVGLPGPDSPALFAAVMGARDRPPMDPCTGATNLPEPPCTSDDDRPYYAIDGGPGTMGSYELTFTIVPTDAAECGLEPDNAVDQLSGYVIEDEGSFACVHGRLNDGPCEYVERNKDLFAVNVRIAPKVLEVRLRSTSCGVGRDVRVHSQSGRLVGYLPPGSNALSDPLVDSSMRWELVEPGEYYIGVAYAYSGYNSFIACSGWGDYGDTLKHDQYDLDIRLMAPDVVAHGSTVPQPAQASRQPYAADNPIVLATSLAEPNVSVVAFGVEGGVESEAFTAPEGPFGGGEGLALYGNDLFFLGRSSLYPYLYRLDAATGDVLETVPTWFGSGVFGDMTVLDGVLYIVDILDRAIYAMPTSLNGTATRLQPGVAMFGAIASAVLPDRLLVSDANDASQIYVLRPDDASLDTTISLARPCPCSADLDHDGDVDDCDATDVQACVGPDDAATTFACLPADLNCDRRLNDADLTILTCQLAGPGTAPNDGCCPKNLPNQVVRATGLAAVGHNELIAADWVVPTLHQFNRNGEPFRSVPLAAPLGKLAGEPVGFLGDGDGNARVDLIDFAAFQRCFSGPSAEYRNRDCEAFDFDIDDDVDLVDYGGYLVGLNQGGG